jgi:hypothetical protein
MSSKKSVVHRRKSSMKKAFSKTQKFGGEGDVSAMSTQELSYNGKLTEVQAKITSGASTVEGDYYAFPPWSNMTNIQAALKGLVDNKKKGLSDNLNRNRMEILLYLIKNDAKTAYLGQYLKANPLPKDFLDSWVERLSTLEDQDDLIESISESQPSSSLPTGSVSTPQATTKDYTPNINAIFVTKKNADPNAPKNILFTVAEDGTAKNMMKLILNYKQDINSVNASGKTPLMVAVEAGNLDVVKIIFETPDIFSNLLKNKKDSAGNTALLLACLADPMNSDMVYFLVGKMEQDEMKITNNAGQTSKDIVNSKIKELTDRMNSPTYAEQTTPAQKEMDKNLKYSYENLLSSIKRLLPDDTQASPATSVSSSTKAIAKPAQTINPHYKVLENYVNQNFKELYLQFIDNRIYTDYDKNWKPLSKICKKNIGYAVKEETCVFPNELDLVKPVLLTEIVKYFNNNNEKLSFENVLDNIILKGVPDEKKNYIKSVIREDIQEKEKELAEKYPKSILNPASYFMGGSPDDPMYAELMNYVNKNFKQLYLQYIDYFMWRRQDANWKPLSMICKKNFGYLVNPGTCVEPKNLNEEKSKLYDQIVNYVNQSNKRMTFEMIVDNLILSDVHTDTKNKIKGFKLIQEDIKKSEAELNAKYPKSILNPASYFMGGSRCNKKKRATKKTRKQKK